MALANHICWTRIEQNNQVRISLLKIKTNEKVNVLLIILSLREVFTLFSILN